MTDANDPLDDEARAAFPGRTVAYSVECGPHLVATFDDGASSCTCGARWSPVPDSQLRRMALRRHVEGGAPGRRLAT